MISTDDIALCKKSTEFRCIEQWKKDLPWVSYSSREKFKNCRQAYYYYKVCGITCKDKYKSSPLKLGSIWDEFIEYAYENKSFKKRFQELIKKYELTEYEIATIEPMFMAYKALGLVNEPNGVHQKGFEYITPHCVINGKLDVAYTDYFEEHKFSGSPSWYTVPYNIADQLSTYFLQDSKLKYCVMKIVQKPLLRMKKNEDIEQFSQRIYSTVISQPSKYFIGYDRKAKTYGKKFYRDEFQPLDDVVEDYDVVTVEMVRALKEKIFWQEKRSCMKFGEPNACEYMDICDTKGVDEEKYNVKYGKDSE